jgi:hypothetical protein
MIYYVWKTIHFIHELHTSLEVSKIHALFSSQKILYGTCHIECLDICMEH